MTTLQKLLQDYRTKSGKTYREMSRELGIEHTTLQNYAKGISGPPLNGKHLKTLETFFSVPFYDLLDLIPEHLDLRRANAETVSCILAELEPEEQKRLLEKMAEMIKGT